MTRIAGILGLFTASLAAVGSAHGQGTTIPNQAVYQVTISGVASGWSFSRTGYVVIAPTYDRYNASGTGLNARDFALISGSPYNNPQRGAIQFGTNVGMFGAASRLDVAYVSVNSSTGYVTIRTAPNISYGSSFELFNVSSGLTADVYFITSGSMNLRFSNGWRNLSGTASFSGRGSLYGSASYSATITGYRIQ